VTRVYSTSAIEDGYIEVVSLREVSSRSFERGEIGDAVFCSSDQEEDNSEFSELE